MPQRLRSFRRNDVALSNIPNPIDTLDAEADSGVSETDAEESADCTVCRHGSYRRVLGGRGLMRCDICDDWKYEEIDYD